MKSSALLLYGLLFVFCLLPQLAFPHESKWSDGFCIDLPADVTVVTWPLVRDRIPDAQPGKGYMLNADNSIVAMKTKSPPIREIDRDLENLVKGVRSKLATIYKDMAMDEPVILDQQGARIAKIHGLGVLNDSMRHELFVMMILCPDGTMISFSLTLKGDEVAKRADEISKMLSSIHLAK